jgi:altronate hydrolase
MHPKDNVLVALQNLSAGENIHFNEENYILLDEVKAKHKFYIADLKTGSEVYM